MEVATLRAVVGSFITGEVISDTPPAVCNSVRGEIASGRASYFEVFEGRRVHAIEAKRPKRIDPYTPRFAVGQAWRFLDSRANSTHRSIIERVRRSRSMV